MVNPFVMAMALMMGPPKYRFHKDLYEKLVREREDGGTLAAPEPEPEVQFEMGPLDGQLGAFDPKTNRITIDVLENYVASVTGKETGPEDLKREFDERMTRTLAHEGGHWHLQRRVGWWPIWEKIGIQGGCLAVLTGLVWLSYSMILNRVLDVAVWASRTYGASGTIASIVTTIAIVFTLIRVMSHALVLARVLAFAAMYRLCYTERYARRWEQKPATDPRWEGVIETQ